MINGVDISKWQGDIDWPKLLSNDVRFMFIKCSDGITVDPKLNDNVAACKLYDVPFGLYHFWQPDIEITKQTNLFCDLVIDHQPILEPAYDLEKPPGEGIDYQAGLEKSFNKFISCAQRDPIIYSNVSFAKQYLQFPEAYHKELWIASWTKKEEPTLPTKFKTWLFWQHDCKNQLGPDYGVKTKSICLDRYNGTAEEFYIRYNLDIPDNITGFLYRSLLDLQLYTRPDPYAGTGQKLSKGEIIEIDDIIPEGDTWLLTKSGDYVLLSWNGTKLLERYRP